MNDKNNYRILCLGTYCLPRVITTLCGFKPRRANGEKTCPFDLAFCWDFNGIVDYIDNEFKTFFDDLEFDWIKNIKLKSDLFRIFGTKLSSKVWKIEKAGFYFNHEQNFDREKFIEIYTTRIKNFYDFINDKDKKLYIVIASFDKITTLQIEKLNSIISRYRPYNSFCNIIINQNEQDIDISSPNTFVLNCNSPDIKKLFKGGWTKMLEKKSVYPAVDKLNDIIQKGFENIMQIP